MKIVADLRDDLIRDFKRADALALQTLTTQERAEFHADLALDTMTRWCAKEPKNDN